MFVHKYSIIIKGDKIYILFKNLFIGAPKTKLWVEYLLRKSISTYVFFWPFNQSQNYRRKECSSQRC